MSDKSYVEISLSLISLKKDKTMMLIANNISERNLEQDSAKEQK